MARLPHSWSPTLPHLAFVVRFLACFFVFWASVTVFVLPCVACLVMSLFLFPCFVFFPFFFSFLLSVFLYNSLILFTSIFFFYLFPPLFHYRFYPSLLPSFSPITSIFPSFLKSFFLSVLFLTSSSLLPFPIFRVIYYLSSPIRSFFFSFIPCFLFIPLWSCFLPSFPPFSLHSFSLYSLLLLWFRFPSLLHSLTPLFLSLFLPTSITAFSYLSPFVDNSRSEEAMWTDLAFNWSWENSQDKSGKGDEVGV